MLPKLLEQIPLEEPIDTVTADGAYDTRACHNAVAAREATAFVEAPIPPDRILIILTPNPPQRSALEGNHTKSPGSQ
jgi:hypothetical protein